MKVHRNTKSSLGTFILPFARFKFLFHPPSVGSRQPVLQKFPANPKAKPEQRLQANGVVEKLDRQLKAAIMCLAAKKRTEVLPAILFEIHVSVKEDISASPAGMVFGFSVPLFRQLFSEERPCYRRRLSSSA
ncbi:hypothetical protein TNIN_449651 [Trichonephila inaurata madagascariensis]|uniref:Uncharacterized protein n=1 Tax=Trichonephila inaurata madagascariensis TaxID=2747483 RepID=A0A8X6I5J8_9ARAC|nr:hypothetical protein TNIN_449651 [Trichonephila inaurata madagascariensis]